MSPEDALDLVVDRETFLDFVATLAREREEAERMERDEPERYMLGGALDWQNSTISTFLDAAAECLIANRDRDSSGEPSWKAFAEFLYGGKIYE
jgi:hypothetical protein